jgi:hypothetical protein
LNREAIVRCFAAIASRHKRAEQVAAVVAAAAAMTVAVVAVVVAVTKLTTNPTIGMGLSSIEDRPILFYAAIHPTL